MFQKKTSYGQFFIIEDYLEATEPVSIFFRLKWRLKTHEYKLQHLGFYDLPDELIDHIKMECWIPNYERSVKMHRYAFKRLKDKK